MSCIEERRLSAIHAIVLGRETSLYAFSYGWKCELTRCGWVWLRGLKDELSFAVAECGLARWSDLSGFPVFCSSCSDFDATRTKNQLYLIFYGGTGSSSDGYRITNNPQENNLL